MVRPMRYSGGPYGVPGVLCNACRRQRYELLNPRPSRRARALAALAVSRPTQNTIVGATIRRLQAPFRAGIRAELRAIEFRIAEVRAEKADDPTTLPLRVYGRPSSAIAESRQAVAS